MNSLPKTLAVDARMIQASGIGTDLQNLLPLMKEHFDITLLGDPVQLKQYAWADNMQIIRFTKPIYSIAEQLLLPLLIPACDYFFSPHFNIPVLPIRAKQRVVLIHDVYHLASNAVNKVHKLYARFLLQRAIDASNKVVTISEFSRSEIQKYLKVGDKMLHKIDLGVDHNLFRKERDAELMQSVGNKYCLPEEFILFVGNVKPHKNLKTLVLALSKLEGSQYQGIKLVVVGKKEGFITGDQSLINLIEQLNLKDRVIFTGYVETEHLPIIYQLARLFVFPSLYEGCGLPPLEAMACGCPTIVSDAASMPEVCRDATYYFDGTNPQALADALVGALQNEHLRDDLILKGLQLSAQHTWQKSSAELCDIILKDK
ncbi:glycosyltransferase family 4 protein [Pontibacter sp. HSC-14F20]|uniref:glycosyltransferase family 4 protein n=1 Tax=Pontibacter sp. HSC-14F20 TaxID=2864136 RepID=UPI001C73602F|nr:glycosyltransferase family 1 protein [Pontibacter sp. HSC-14F20]MBX0331700.1 glycosyltransferase family 4 protein [Pontibacter sp. HSC-14F20]